MRWRPSLHLTPAREFAPVSSWGEHNTRQLEHYRARYEAGAKDALLQAVYWCLGFNEPPPDWVRYHVNAALMRFWLYETTTLDDSFGVTRSTDPRSINAGRKTVELTEPVTLAILDAIRVAKAAGKRLSLDDLLFEEIGARFGIGKTAVKELWARGRAALGGIYPSKKKRARTAC